MAIYLTSYGLDVRYKEYMQSYKEILTLFQNKKVFIIPNAKLASGDRTNSQVAKEELIKHGIKAEIVDLDKQSILLDNDCALYFSGGEPKYLMDSILHSQMKEKIEKFIEEDGIIVGQSAGAMLFNKDYLDTSTGSLKILHNGFDYGHKIIVPHYDHLPEDLLSQIPKDIFPLLDTDNLLLLKHR